VEIELQQTFQGWLY